MLIQHIGLRLKDFYKNGRFAQQMGGLMGAHAQQKPGAPTFRNKHGLNINPRCFQSQPHDAVSLAQGPPLGRGKCPA